jgi:hypothetical protein
LQLKKEEVLNKIKLEKEKKENKEKDKNDKKCVKSKSNRKIIEKENGKNKGKNKIKIIFDDDSDKGKNNKIRSKNKEKDLEIWKKINLEKEQKRNSIEEEKEIKDLENSLIDDYLKYSKSLKKNLTKFPCEDTRISHRSFNEKDNILISKDITKTEENTAILENNTSFSSSTLPSVCLLSNFPLTSLKFPSLIRNAFHVHALFHSSFFSYEKEKNKFFSTANSKINTEDSFYNLISPHLPTFFSLWQTINNLLNPIMEISNPLPLYMFQQVINYLVFYIFIYFFFF